MFNQPSLLALCLLATSFSLLFLLVCVYITQFRSFINMLGLLAKCSLIVLRLTWYIPTVFGNVSNLPIVITGRTSLLITILHIIHLPLWWRFPKGLEGSLYLKPALKILFQLQCNFPSFIQGYIGHSLHLHLDKFF